MCACKLFNITGSLVLGKGGQVIISLLSCRQYLCEIFKLLLWKVIVSNTGKDFPATLFGCECSVTT